MCKPWSKPHPRLNRLNRKNLRFNLLNPNPTMKSPHLQM